MKLTLRYAVFLAALLLALGSVGMMRPEVATANEDVVFMDPPTDRGDPDSGGGNFATFFGWRLTLGPPRGQFGLRRVSLIRTTNVSRVCTSSSAKHQRATRR